jgi:hypothetical protein
MKATRKGGGKLKSNHIGEYVSSGTSPTRGDSKKNSSTAQSVLVQHEPLLLDMQGVARALSAWAVRSVLWDGKIPFIKIGRRFLVDPADLRTYISREKSGGAA